MTHVEDIEDLPDSEVVSLADTPKPVTKATNHRAFQNLIDENADLKRDLKRKEEKLESYKTKNKVSPIESIHNYGLTVSLSISLCHVSLFRLGGLQHSLPLRH